MKRIFTIEELGSEIENDPSLWTAIVPMAGKGTRLDFKKPKALYPIRGKTILDWLLATLSLSCRHAVLVVAPEGKTEIEAELKRLRHSIQVKAIVQSKPKGMADAVLMAESEVKTPFSAVVWGDQVTLSSRTLRACQSLMEKQKAALSLPTFLKKNPYIVFDRDEEGRICRIRQKREGEVTENYGENDCGVFCFETKQLFKVLKREKSVGKNTEEYNLLPLIPFFEDSPAFSLTIRIDSDDETLGVNTRDDAKRAEEILAKR